MEEAGKADEAVSWANTASLADHQRVRGHTVWPEDDLPRTHTLKVKKNVVVDRITGAAAMPSKESSAQTPEVSHSAVELMVAEIAGIPPARVSADMALDDDLELDSLKRVELLSAIEEGTGVYVDETQIKPGTTVQTAAGHGRIGLAGRRR